MFKIILIVFLFFPTFACSYDAQVLSKTRAWQQLLHMREGKSEIDASSFFLSPAGKTDAKAELESTLQALYEGEDIACRFPDRVYWLFEKIPSLSQRVEYTPCEVLEQHLDDTPITQAVLVFPTALINAPASMFGHTFLRLDDVNGLALMSQAVNYAAKTPDKHDLLFAYRGLFGGYEGRYSVLPYYQKIKEYNKLERRDLWEYTLNVSPEELQRLQRHLYALKTVFSDYYFMRENCSYNLLWLLEVARPSARLISHFQVMATPMDTIKVLAEQGFIMSSMYRPSQSKELLALHSAVKTSQGERQKAYKAQLEVGLLQLSRNQGKIKKKPYVKKLMELLAKRSHLPKVDTPKIARPNNPLLSHASHKLELGMDSGQRLFLDMKMAYHDIYDVDRGFSQGSYIDFMHVQLCKATDETVQVDVLDIVDIQSYAVRDAIFKPYSWTLSLGMARFREEMSLKFATGYGLSYALGEGSLGFIMMGSTFYYHDSPLLAITPRVGVLASFEDVKLGVLGERNFYADGSEDVKAEVFATWMFDAHRALNLKVNHDKIDKKESEQTWNVSLFYYF